MYKLRGYQTDAVSSVINHFKKDSSPAVVVLPTGAGKSLVIAELARLARGRVLVLAHVKELVEQNFSKYESYGLCAGIYSAGLKRKDKEEKVIFGSIQSVVRADKEFFGNFSLVVIDECHRVGHDPSGQYQQVISKLQSDNSDVKILGLTATPYRLDSGWIYNFHEKGIIRTTQERFFKECIFELPLSYMIKNKYLTEPVMIDSPVACYDFSSLFDGKSTSFIFKDIEDVLKRQSRVTPTIIQNIIDQSTNRNGVMIFTSSISHAHEVLQLLPKDNSCIITGETSNSKRDEIIQDFKDKKIKFLVNVSVLTTGFDAPHVDIIAILRPTESVSLYQQIVGRGLRLSEGKKDCLILDYTGIGHNLYSPEVGEKRPSANTEPVNVPCPQCGHENTFWGILNEFGAIEEHFGRKCQGAHKNDIDNSYEVCGHRFRYKVCQSCGEENDIAARKCHSCSEDIIDSDKKLKEAMSLKDAHVMKPDSMYFDKSYDKNNKEKLEVRYYDLDGEFLKEEFLLDDKSSKKAFYYNFIRPHIKNPGPYFDVVSVDQVIHCRRLFRLPEYVIARKVKKYWKIREKLF
jgi:DNA repair protein RadD